MEQQPFFKEFIKLTKSTFTYVTLANAIIFLFFEDPFASERSFSTFIFQLLFLSAINSLISVLVPRMFNQIRQVWHLVINMFACLTATLIILVSFGLIHVYSWQNWALVVGSFVIVFGLVSCIMIFKTKREDARLAKQLENYKLNQSKGDE